MKDLVNWKDHVVEHPNRYQETDLGGGQVELVKDPGTVIQQGTPQSASNFNQMDWGILDNDMAIRILTQHMMMVDNHLEDLDSETVPETGTITLTNTKRQPFNDSQQTVAFSTVRNDLDYIVEFVVTEFSGGCVGDIIISDKALNGFKVAFDGSAKSVTGKYIVKGGMVI